MTVDTGSIRFRGMIFINSTHLMVTEDQNTGYFTILEFKSVSNSVQFKTKIQRTSLSTNYYQITLIGGTFFVVFNGQNLIQSFNLNNPTNTALTEASFINSKNMDP